MSKKHKHDLETRIQIVKEYQSGQISLIQIGNKYGLWTIVNKMDKKMCTKKKNK